MAWHVLVELLWLHERHRQPWRCSSWSRSSDRIHKVWSYQHQQLGIAAIDRSGAEQFPQNGNISNSRNFAQLYGGPVVQQTSNSKRLAVFQLDFRLRPAGRKCWHSEPGDGHGITEVQGADFRENVQTDGVVGLGVAQEI